MIRLKKISETEWEIPIEDGMKVPGKIFANEKLLRAIKKDKTIEQIKNVARLPGILRYSFAMPDAHQGYGFSIGSVAGFDKETGVICPGGVGYDINCGIRTLVTDISAKEFLKIRKEFLKEISKRIPSGVGGENKELLKEKDLDKILVLGAEFAVKNGLGKKEDLENCEEKGKIKGANPKDVSLKAKKRGINQTKTLGSGNHFLEIQEIKEIFDKKNAKAFSLEKGKIAIMIHCGSRGLGHQIASDYIQEMQTIDGLNKELVNSPIQSELGKKYLSAMNCAVNFAFYNRQVIMNEVREILKGYFPKSKISLLYDVCHNIAKFEKHLLNGKKKEILVIRKGATRAFGKGRKEVPKKYREFGQPVIIPGSMGTASYILVGRNESEEKSFSSSAHGAGRVISRMKAKEKFSAEKIIEELNKNNILIETASKKGLVEEAPEVYKDIEEVIKVSENSKLTKKIARLIPIAVIKG